MTGDAAPATVRTVAVWWVLSGPSPPGSASPGLGLLGCRRPSPWARRCIWLQLGQPADAAWTLVDAYGLSLLIPVVALVFASAALGDLAEDGTLVYLWLRPLPRWQLALAAFAASVTVAVPVAVLPLVDRRRHQRRGRPAGRRGRGRRDCWPRSPTRRSSAGSGSGSGGPWPGAWPIC